MNARSLHVATNTFSTAYYHGMLPELVSCENDAMRLADLATARKFEAKILTSNQAVFTNVDAAITDAATHLKSGDYFLFTFSSHGVSEDLTASGWCLPDRIVKRHGVAPSIDDWLSRFNRGVRILGIANCCSAGEAASTPSEVQEHRRKAFEFVKANHRRDAGIASDWMLVRFAESSVDYVRRLVAPAVKADVITIAACGIGQFALDGDDDQHTTPFVAKVLEIANDDKYSDFDDFLRLLKIPVVPERVPEMSRIGTKNGFDTLGPFRPTADQPAVTPSKPADKAA